MHAHALRAMACLPTTPSHVWFLGFRLARIFAGPRVEPAGLHRERESFRGKTCPAVSRQVVNGVRYDYLIILSFPYFLRVRLKTPNARRPVPTCLKRPPYTSARNCTVAPGPG